MLSIYEIYVAHITVNRKTNRYGNE